MDDFEFSGRGAVTPPADLHDAAKKTLGNEYSLFIAQYGENFTPQQLVKFAEQ
jgi:hypothetical protein